MNDKERDALRQAIWNGDVAAACVLLAVDPVSPEVVDAHLAAAVRVGSVELLAALLRHGTPSPAAIDQACVIDAAAHPETFERLLSLGPTPAALTSLVDSTASMFATRFVSVDADGNEAVTLIEIAEPQRAQLVRVFEAALSRGAHPSDWQVPTMVVGLVSIGRADLADRLVSRQRDLSDVAYFAFRDRSEAGQRYVREHAQLRGSVGSAALCGAVADGNAELVQSLLVDGADPREPFRSTIGNPDTVPINLITAATSVEIVRALLAAGARPSVDAATTALSSRNIRALGVLLDAGVDPNLNDGALLTSAVAQQNFDAVRVLREHRADPTLNGHRALLVARELRGEAFIGAIEEHYTANGIDMPPVPAPWTASIDLGTAELDQLWQEWMAFGHARLFAAEAVLTPATDDELAAAQHSLGVTLPPEVIALYRITNGEPDTAPFGRGLLFGQRLLPLADVVRAHDSWQATRASITDTPNDQPDGTSTPSGTVKCEHSNAGWIPLTDVNGNNLSIDTDPGPAGTTGQLISSGRDELHKVCFGTSLTDALRRLLRQIAADNVEVLLDSGFSLGHDRAGLVDAVRTLIVSASW